MKIKILKVLIKIFRWFLSVLFFPLKLIKYLYKLVKSLLIFLKYLFKGIIWAIQIATNSKVIMFNTISFIIVQILVISIENLQIQVFLLLANFIVLSFFIIPVIFWTINPFRSIRKLQKKWLLENNNLSEIAMKLYNYIYFSYNYTTIEMSIQIIEAVEKIPEKIDNYIENRLTNCN